MSGDDKPDDLRKIFELWVDSEMKVHILVFYHNNPGVIETAEGLARRLGTDVESLRNDLADQVEMGILRERKAGDKTVLVYDRKREAELTDVIQDALDRWAAGVTS